MSVPSILAPVFVLVALTFFLMFWTGAARYGSVSRRETHMGDVALGQLNWPARIMQIGNSFNNQFQLPMLFYVLVILAMTLRHADFLFVILSWVFVVLRILHACVHTTSNHMGQRFGVYVAGAIVLVIMWAIFAFRILLYI